MVSGFCVFCLFVGFLFICFSFPCISAKNSVQQQIGLMMAVDFATFGFRIGLGGCVMFFFCGGVCVIRLCVD